MAEDIGMCTDRFLFPKKGSPQSALAIREGDVAPNQGVNGMDRWHGFFRHVDRPSATNLHMQSLCDKMNSCKKRCGEIRAKKGPGEKFTIADLTYIFTEDNEIIGSCIAQLIATKDLQHPIFSGLCRDLEILDISLDEVAGGV